jgi:hypothetical protein
MNMGSAEHPQSCENPKHEDELVFSMKDDAVWVTWPGTSATVRLGPHDAVTAMMRDYLAQTALAERLQGRLSEGRRPQ